MTKYWNDGDDDDNDDYDDTTMMMVIMNKISDMIWLLWVSALTWIVFVTIGAINNAK